MRVVQWMAEALADMNEYQQYMKTRNPEAGERIIERVFLCVDQIAENPLFGKPGQVFETREKKVADTPLRIIYRVDGDVIQVLFIPHDRQQWPPVDTED